MCQYASAFQETEHNKNSAEIIEFNHSYYQGILLTYGRVHRYTMMELADRFALMNVAFDQEDYRVDEKLNVQE